MQLGNLTAIAPSPAISQALPEFTAPYVRPSMCGWRGYGASTTLKKAIVQVFSLKYASDQVPKFKKSHGVGGVVTGTGLDGWESLGTILHVWRR